MRPLGKLPARHDPRVPHLMHLARPADLPPVPRAVDWTDGIEYGPMRNAGRDAIGDCTAAAIGHAIQTWTAHAQAEIVLTDQQVVDLYAATSGYRPDDPATDQGAVCADVLAYCNSKGIWQGPQRLEILSGYARISLGNALETRAAIAWLGGVYAGLALPISAQEQDVWAVPNDGATGQGAPGSWGGHAVWVAGYGDAGLTCVSWGQRVRMTWAFWLNYADEAYGLVSRDWLNTRGVSPAGLDFDALRARMGEIAG